MAAQPTAGELESADEATVEGWLPTLDASSLEALVARANREYWQDNAATLSDPLYDRLVEALRRLNPDAPILESLGEPVPEGPVLEADAARSIPPAERLGAPVRHQRSMLSLDKCYTPEDLMSWAKKIEGDILVMPKMDGIACSLRYDGTGKLWLAATRGSGGEGEDITVNVLEVEDIPAQLPADPAIAGRDIEIRGELYMRLSVFRSRFAKDYSNPRNLTAGAIKHKDRGSTKNYSLSFFPYDITGTELPEEPEKVALLKTLGFDPDRSRVVPREEMVAAFERFSAERSADELDYEIDGVVYRASAVAERERLGETGHHPRWSIAYKFQGDSGITTLEDVQWSVSRTGTVTPVAILKPIELSGAMIGRASLHNLGRFEELAPTKGAQVEVTRRGGVIPNVERVVEPGPDGEKFTVPTQCPACGGPVERRTKRDGEFLYCVDPDNCISARLGELQHYAKVVDIEGFGPKIVKQAVDRGLLSSPADYYTLTLEDLEQFERLGRRSAQNLIDQVNGHRNLELPVFLRSLGIDHLGRQNAELLAREFRGLARIRALTEEDLMAVKGIKEAIAEKLVAGLARRAPLMDALLEHVTVTDLPEVPDEAETAGPPEGPLDGKSYLFTGALEAFSRKEAQALVEEHGGVNASGVSKKLDVLVVGAGKGNKSSKQKKAEKLVEAGDDLEIIGEADFLTRIGK